MTLLLPLHSPPSLSSVPFPWLLHSLSMSPPTPTKRMSQEKANLARIRDNQRRSRARRKEYLQELEARLRQCEMQGIEASAEIQMAARKVADENKKLRSLLGQHGVGDDGIESYLQSSPTHDLLSGPNGGNVLVLEHLLQARKICSADGTPVPNMNMGMSQGSRQSSVTASTSQWEPIQASLCAGEQQMLRQDCSTHQFYTPSTTGSRAHSVISTGKESSLNASQIPRYHPVPMPSPALSSSHQTALQSFDYDSQLLPTSLIYNSSFDPQQASPYLPPTNNSNSNSCVYAADMITNMAGGDPSMISAELGCMPGMDCEVDNQLVCSPHVSHVYPDQYSGLGPTSCDPAPMRNRKN